MSKSELLKEVELRKSNFGSILFYLSGQLAIVKIADKSFADSDF